MSFKSDRLELGFSIVVRALACVCVCVCVCVCACVRACVIHDGGLQTLLRFQLKYLSIDEMVGALCFGCCQAHRGLPVEFLLLRYSVFTAESLPLLYLLFIT